MQTETGIEEVFSLSFHYQVEKDYFAKFSPDEVKQKQGFYSNYGVYHLTDPTEIDVWLPQKFTRVNQITLGEKYEIGTVHPGDNRVVYDWSSQFSLIGIATYFEQIYYHRKAVGNVEDRVIDLISYIGVILVDNLCVECYFEVPEAPACTLDNKGEEVAVSWQFND